MPISPLVSTATAIEAQANHIQRRRDADDADGCCAISTPASTPVSAAETPMSSELKWLPRFQPGAASSTAPESIATAGPNQRRAAITMTTRPNAPLSATQSRACHSPMPKASKANAVIHIWNGGFSKYLMPL